jgi:hypothetical protein
LTAPDDEQQTSVSNKVVDEPRTWAPAGGESPAEAQARGDDAASDPFNDRPHVWVAGAFVGGIVFAKLLKRLGRGDD